MLIHFEATQDAKIIETYLRTIDDASGSPVYKNDPVTQMTISYKAGNLIVYIYE